MVTGHPTLSQPCPAFNVRAAQRPENLPHVGVSNTLRYMHIVVGLSGAMCDAQRVAIRYGACSSADPCPAPLLSPTSSKVLECDRVGAPDVAEPVRPWSSTH